MQDLTIVVGHYGLFLALATSAWSVLAALLGAGNRGKGLQRSAERALQATFGLILLASGCLVYGFLTNDFRLDYVYHYSSSTQPLPYKIGAFWGGQAGSLLLWGLFLAAMGALMVRTNRRKNRALMPIATAVIAGIALFFMILLNFFEPPFETSVMRADGVGLNPQLKNFWMMIHPPTLYLGYVGFSIPFAFGIAALATRRTGDIWFRTTRRWTIFSWFFLGTGILLGSYWAYIELGWGGYWAWDPVENASLMPWLTGTAFLHSVMIQEKRQMLKVWNVFLIILTFSLSIFGTFLTRSGIISSVHSFATSNIGAAFAVFLAIIVFGSLLLLISRLPNLKSEGRLESVVSRESSFVFNNLILVGMAATVLFLTTFPMLSEAVTGRKVTMGPPIFNMVNVPWALVLLLLVGIGPLIAWRKASAENLKRNFVVPALVGVWVFVLLVMIEPRTYLDAFLATLSSLGTLQIAPMFDEIKTFYPAITFATGMFVFSTVIQEYWRGLRVRLHQHEESVALAFGRMISRNKRRYGGHLVHIGIVVIFFGIAGSAAYQTEMSQMVEPGSYLTIEDYLVRYDDYRLEARDDYIGAVTELSVFERGSGDLIGTLEAEQRMHPNMQAPELREAFHAAKALGAAGDAAYPASVAALYPLISRLEATYRREVKTPSTEVGILASISPLDGTRWGEDFYVIPLWVDPETGRANLRVFVNPMVNFIWFGGLIFIAGSIVSILPDSRERRRLEASMAVEEQAVA